MRTQYPSIRLFKNPWLERFSHIHPALPWVVWLPLSTWLIASALWVHELPVLTVLAVGACGLLSWTLAEYLLHRFFFHYKAERAQRFFFIMHGIHHLDPVDETRLVMPPMVSVTGAAILYPLFRWALGPAWADAFFGFFALGYLAYDGIHYTIHHTVPRTRWGRWLRQHHMIHHYVNSESRWGVSTPLWDWVFGTLGEARPAHKKSAGPGAVPQALRRKATSRDRRKQA